MYSPLFPVINDSVVIHVKGLCLYTFNVFTDEGERCMGD